MKHTRLLGTVLAAGLIGGLGGGCEEDPPTQPPADTTPPAPVSDLVLLTAKGRASGTLTWTAPGDDGVEGTASQYDVRYASTPITEASWEAATRAANVPAPQAAGSSESLALGPLAEGVTYYAALKSVDDADNWSALSNVAQSTTPDQTPPAAVTDLATLSPLETSVTLTWTAPGDDAAVGTASSYDIRYATRFIIESNWDQAVQVSGEPTPGPAGTAETFIVQGLSPRTAYCFALKTADEGGRWSELSNRPFALTGPLPEPPEMIPVPAGSFIMGDGAATCGVDERAVTLTHAFQLSRTEVTNQQYLDAVQWALLYGYVTATPSSVIDNLDGSTVELLDLDDPEGDCEIEFSDGFFILRDVGHGLNPDNPVIEVTWYGAAAYCDWMSLIAGLPRAYDHATWACGGGDPYAAAGYRLPTDAEWEFTAQYDDERLYPWGNEAPDDSRANYQFTVGWTSIVGSYPGGPSIGGELLYDLAGNVFEWCNDWHVCSLGTTPVTDPAGPVSGTERVVRGGSWSGNASYLRAAARGAAYPPTRSSYSIGFRVARSQ